MSRATLNAWAALTAGSIAGGFARYYLAGAVLRAVGPGFPYGTFLVNVTGCFLIGIFDCMAVERFVLNPLTALMLMTGFCGAFTTFSTLILETSNLMKAGDYALAVLNAAGSFALGMIAFRLGISAGKLL